MEKGEKKLALVKLRLCPSCSDKLNYTKMHEKRAKRPREEEIVQEPEAKKLEIEEKSDVWIAPIVKEEQEGGQDDFDAFLSDLFS
jgi:protein FRA10AC1